VVAARSLPAQNQSFIGPIQIQAVTQTTYAFPGGGSDTIAAGATYITPAQGSFVSGTFNFIGPTESGYVGLNIPSGSITGGTGGAMVTENASGLVTAINSGAVITGSFPAPTPASGGLPAAIGASSSPGLAGNAGIQPQLNTAGLAEWARGLAGPELNAELAAVPGPELAGLPV